MDIQIKTIHDIKQFQEIDTAWDEMIARSFDNNPFLRHHWFLNYYQAFYPESQLNILTAYKDGQMAAALPMVLKNTKISGLKFNTVQFLAGSHSHFNRIPVLDRDVETLFKFIEFLLSNDIELICLEKTPDGYIEMTHIVDYAKKKGLLLETRCVESSPFIRAVGSYEDYKQNLSKNFRKSLNNRLNRINRIDFRINIFTAVEQIDDILDDIRKISRNSWQGIQNSGLLSTKENFRFYSNLIRHSLERKYGFVAILYIKNVPAAYEYHIIHGKHEYCIKCEYSQEFSNLSAGGVLDMKLVERAFNDDCVEMYELLGVSQNYKLRWTEHLNKFTSYYVFNRSIKSVIAYNLKFGIKSRLRRIKIFRKMKDYIDYLRKKYE